MRFGLGLFLHKEVGFVEVCECEILQDYRCAGTQIDHGIGAVAGGCIQDVLRRGKLEMLQVQEIYIVIKVGDRIKARVGCHKVENICFRATAESI